VFGPFGRPAHVAGSPAPAVGAAPHDTWLDEDAWACLVLVARMEDRFSAEIMELEWTHQMWTFVRSRYEPTGQSTFLPAIRQEQLLR
jgi:hypothetical protein